MNEVKSFDLSVFETNFWGGHRSNQPLKNDFEYSMNRYSYVTVSELIPDLITDAIVSATASKKFTVDLNDKNMNFMDKFTTTDGQKITEDVIVKMLGDLTVDDFVKVDANYLSSTKDQKLSKNTKVMYFYRLQKPLINKRTGKKRRIEIYVKIFIRNGNVLIQSFHESNDLTF